MSVLSAFLNPVSVAEEKEVVISNRFVKRDEKGKVLVDEAGKPIPQPFKIRTLTQEVNEMIGRKCRKTVVVNGVPQERVDDAEYGRQVVLAAVVEPDFSDAELCMQLGVVDPSLAPGKLLLAGEYTKLQHEIMQFSGFGSMSLEEQAKN